jgi:chromosome partitioning protein
MPDQLVSLVIIIGVFMTAGGTPLIVFANEKGGTGKSTTAVHVAIAFVISGRRVVALDLDTRQRTLGRYMDNRIETCRRHGYDLLTPKYATFDPSAGLDVIEWLDTMGRDQDVVIVDTPGRHDIHSLAAIARAETLVTPINDSFLDLDLIGQVDPDNFGLSRPSFYAKMVWEARKKRQESGRPNLAWVVLRNRLQHIQAGNMRRVGAALGELSTKVGFDFVPGLTERVIYREWFTRGLTFMDLRGGVPRIMAADAELKRLMLALRLPGSETLESLQAMQREHSQPIAV